MQSSDTLQSRKKRWHFSVEKDFVCDPKLSPMARMLYLVLMSYASPTSPVPFPGMRTLSTILQCTEDTVRKYRVELEQSNWLEVERRRDGHHKYLSNAYVLLDGPDDAGAMPKKPDMAFSGHGQNPSRVNHETKRVPVQQGETSEAKSHQQQQYRASGVGAPAATKPTPSAALSGGTPEPPDADKGPRQRSETFIQHFKQWGKAAQQPATVVPSEREDLSTFFRDNPETEPAHLLAIMLTAWMMENKSAEDDEQYYEKYWHCRVKSRRIKTFLQFLPNIQDELEWKGGPAAIQKAMQCAQSRFLHQKAA